jgi:sucrose-6-phosphate hydrolase SacC (GH32 family)
VYNAQGVGDVEFTAECGSLVSEIYAIEDCLLANHTQTETYSSTGVIFRPIYNMPSEMPVEITGNIKSSSAKQFGLCLKEDNNQTNNQYIRAGAEGTYNGATITSNSYTQSNNTTSRPTANVEYPVKITYDGTDITGYIEGSSVISHSKTFGANYVMLLAWGVSGRTVTISDLKIKPL